MLLTAWRTWLVALIALVLPRNPETIAQLEWPRIQDVVASRLARDPMVWTLQEGNAQSYAYTYSPSGSSSRIGVDIPQARQSENSVFGQDTSEDVQREAGDTGRSLSAQPTEDTERSPDAQARFIGRFDEWYKGKGKGEEEEEKQPQIIISTHHGISSHDLDHHHVDHHNHHEHHNHHDHSHSYHGPPHAHLPPFPHHAPPPPMYHYPHHHQQPVVQPIIIESGRGKGGGNKKKKGSKGNAVVTVYTETVVVTEPKPVVLTQTVTHLHQTQSYPVYVPTSKPVYVTPSQVYLQSSNQVYSTPSHVYISSSTPIYATPSHVYVQTPVHTQYLTPSHVFIQEPQTEYVAVSIETEDHGWGWGWDLFGSNGKGSGHGGGQVQVIGDGHHHHHHGADKGKGQVVYVMEKPEVAPQLVTTHVVVQQQIPLMTNLAHPSTSEVMIMERPSHTIKKGFDRVRETFKAFGDGIKGMGDKFAEGVHHIKSKFSFQSKDSEDPHYVLLQPQNTHSVLVVTTAAPQTVVVQKPITQTVMPKPVVQTVAAYQPMVSNKGGTYLKGNFKGYSYGKGKSKGGDAVIIVSGDGHGYGHGHHHSHGSECLHCG